MELEPFTEKGYRKGHCGPRGDPDSGRAPQGETGGRYHGWRMEAGSLQTGAPAPTPRFSTSLFCYFFFFFDSGNPGKIWIRKREFSKITNRPTKNSENHRTQYTSQVRNTGFGVRRPGFESPPAVWAWPFLYLSVPQFPHLYNAG